MAVATDGSPDVHTVRVEGLPDRDQEWILLEIQADHADSSERVSIAAIRSDSPNGVARFEFLPPAEGVMWLSMKQIDGATPKGKGLVPVQLGRLEANDGASSTYSILDWITVQGRVLVNYPGSTISNIECFGSSDQQTTISLHADHSFELLGLTRGKWTFQATLDTFPWFESLAEAYSETRTIEIERNRDLTLKLSGSRGTMVLVSAEGNLSDEAFSYGASPMALGAPQVRHEGVSLGQIQASGCEEFCIHVPGSQFFYIAVSELRVDSDGLVRVPRPNALGGTIVIRHQDRNVRGEWCVFAQDVRRVRDAYVASRSGETAHLISGIPPGTYSLWWLDRDASVPRTASLAKGVELQAGQTIVLSSGPPKAARASIRIENWSDLPSNMKPHMVNLDGVHVQSPSDEGVFEATVHSPLTEYRSIRLQTKSIAGWLTSIVTHVSDHELVLRVSIANVVAINVPSLFGGSIAVSHWFRPERIFGSTIPWTKRAVAQQADGHFLMTPGVPSRYGWLEIRETHPKTGKSLLLGVFAIPSNEDSIQAIAGRWVEVRNVSGLEVDIAGDFKSEKRLPALALGRIAGERGLVWVPSAITAIELRGRYGVRRVSCPPGCSALSY